MKLTPRTMIFIRQIVTISVVSVLGGWPFYSAAQDSGIESAKLVPVDADLYSVALRIPEQWNRFVAGPVVSKFLELPAVENAVEQFRSEWSEREGFGATARTAMENPNAKEGLAFVRDLISSEIFMFGDKHLSQGYFAQAKFNDDMRLAALNSELDETERAVQSMKSIAKMFEDLNVPTMMVGAKCKDVDLALGKIDQLEAVIQLGMSQIPNGSLIFKNFERIDDARGDRIQLRLDGIQIPWDEIPTNEVFNDEVLEQFQKVFAKKSITITLGMFDGFFVFAVSPSSKAILELGKVKSILEHPHMQAVKEAAANPLTYVGYTSDELSKATFDANLNNFFSRNFATTITPILGLISEDSEIRDFAKDLMNDCKWVDESIAKLVPEFKGSTAFSFLTLDGWEMHNYARTADAISESIAPLSMLEHLGPDPMLFTATKLQYRPEFFQLSRKMVQKLKSRLDESYELDWSGVDAPLELAGLFGPTLSTSYPDHDWDSILESENIKSSIDFCWPFLVRIADTWEKKFLPAMSGEHAIVLSGGNLAAKQWLKDMPPSVDPLVLPEIAALCGIKDRAMLDNAFEELFKICDDMVVAMRENVPNSIPDGYKIPRPVKSQGKIGVTYGYAIPADCPVPKEMMPQVLFIGNIMIESYSDKQSQSLAEVRKLEKGLSIIDPNAKHSSVSYVHVGKIFEFARPWIRYALTEGMENMDDSLTAEVLPENYELTAKDLLSAWSVLGKIGEFVSTTSSTPTGGSHIRSVYKSQK